LPQPQAKLPLTLASQFQTFLDLLKRICINSIAFLAEMQK
jgi:hypothetical protein